MPSRLPHLSLLFLLLGLTLIACSRSDPAAKSGNLFDVEAEPAVQQAAERDVIGRASEMFGRPELVDHEHVFDPMQIVVDSSGPIYVLDKRDARVKMLRRDGTFVRSYGEGRGRGPGAFEHVASFAVGPEGSVWIAGQSKAAVFAEDGHAVDHFPYERTLERVVIYPNGAMLAHTVPDTSIFKAYALDDGRARPVAAFGFFDTDRMFDSLDLLGSIGASGIDSFVFVSFYTGLLGRFSTDGAVGFYVESIDGRQPGPDVSANRTSARIKPRSPIVQFLANVDGDRFFVARSSSKESADGLFLDTYRTSDGRYLRSMLYDLTEKDGYHDCALKHVAGGALYTMCREGLVRWFERDPNDH